jgi:hypothetical protein
MIFSIGCMENIKDINNEVSEEDWRNWPIESDYIQGQGISKENCEEEEIIHLEANYATRVTLILEWRDEPNETGYENKPDSFKLTVITPWQEIYNSDLVFNPIREVGLINVTIDIQEDGITYNSANGKWTIIIHCGECGDQVSEPFNIVMPDVGNEWELTFYYEYHEGE